MVFIGLCIFIAAMSTIALSFTIHCIFYYVQSHMSQAMAQTQDEEATERTASGLNQTRSIRMKTNERNLAVPSRV